MNIIYLTGQIKINSSPVQSIEKSFKNTGDARAFLKKLTYNKQRVKLKGAKIGEYYFSGTLYKKKSDETEIIDKF